MAIQILGKQRPDRKKPINMAARLGQTTRDIMKAENLRKSQGGKVSKKVKYLVLFFFIKLLNTSIPNPNLDTFLYESLWRRNIWR